MLDIIHATFFGGAWDGDVHLHDRVYREVKLYTKVAGRGAWAIYKSEDGRRFDFSGYNFNYPGVIHHGT